MFPFEKDLTEFVMTFSSISVPGTRSITPRGLRDYIQIEYRLQPGNSFVDNPYGRRVYLL